MLLSDFSYDYPAELVAQEAIEPRDASKMLVLDRASSQIQHHIFRQLPDFFKQGDVLILNNTKVLPARLFAKKETGGKVEVLFLKPQSENVWECLISNLKNLKEGSPLFFDFKGVSIQARLVENKDKIKKLEFSQDVSVRNLMEVEGAAPLPPYIRRDLARKEDRDRYQAIFAEKEGAIAAPTASLHFTEEVMKGLRNKGVEIHYITLHVGMGTFEPIKSENIQDHVMQTEFYEILPCVVEAIQKAKEEKRSVTAVGTTVVRSLESYFTNPPLTKGETGGFNSTSLFITPGYPFKIIDRFLTNFHQPASTPLLLTSSFAGKDFLFEAYRKAIQKKYRLFSYGDCMLIE